MVRGRTVSIVEFDALGELFRLGATRPNQMPIIEDGELKRVLDPPGVDAFLVRIDGMIQWWPSAGRSALPERAETFMVVEGGPQWVPVTGPQFGDGGQAG